jgi:hypothetical protein
MAAPVPEPEVDILEEDLITVPGQLYALVSFVSPTGNQKNAQCGMKIRGVFASRDEANTHVRRLQKTDPKFDVYMVDMYKWLVVPPDPSQIADQQFQEAYLQTLVSSYHDNQLAAKHHFEERKQSVMLEGLDKNLLPDERIPKSYVQELGDGDGSSAAADGAGSSAAGDGAGSSAAGDGAGSSAAGDGAGSSAAGDGAGSSAQA